MSKTYECEICYKEFKKEDEYKEWVWHSEGDIYCYDCATDIWYWKCSECSSLFSDEVADMDKQEDGTTQCPSCEQYQKPIKANKSDIDQVFNKRIK